MSDELIAVQGILTGMRTLADGTLRTIDFDELQGAEFGLRFGIAINYPVAVARLVEEENGSRD